MANNIYYGYSGYQTYNRFTNLDGIEAKIIQHLLTSNSEDAEKFWKILKYDDKEALIQPNLTLEEKQQLIDGYNTNDLGGQTEQTRLFFSPFVDDAWNKETTSVYLYVDDIYPSTAANAIISVTVETVIHAKINAIYSDADKISNPTGTNPNDYYYTDEINPAVQYKSRATTLLKSIISCLNGLYIDGIGYLSFCNDKTISGQTVAGKATLSLFNRRSFFGHLIHFNVGMSGLGTPESDDIDY